MKLLKKTLRYLQNKGVPPTPMAYFKAFHNVLRLENKKADNELDWQSKWLSQFSPNLQNILKNAQTPDDFIRLISKEVRDQSEVNEHLKQLRTLCHTLLDSIGDVFSTTAKTKLHFLFKEGSLNNIETTSKLADYWEMFRNSKTHINSLKKLVNIVAQMLRTPDSNGNVSKEAMDLSSSLLMHPESLMDGNMIAHIESLLKISNPQSNANTNALESQVKSDELRAMGSHIAVFEVSSVRYLESNPTAQVPLDRALDILKGFCIDALQSGTIIGIYDNGFAVILNASKEEILNRCNPIAERLQAQKFSYHNALFSFSFNIEVLSSESFESFEMLNETLSFKLSNDTKSLNI